MAHVVLVLVGTIFVVNLVLAILTDGFTRSFEAIQVAAERRKRATVLDSEGVQQSRINVAQGQRTAMILESEGHKSELINSAKGKAEAIIANAEASAASILMLAKAVASQGGKDAVGLKLAEEYVEAFGKLAASSNTMLLPTDANDVSAMVAKALLTRTYKNMIASDMFCFMQ